MADENQANVTYLNPPPTGSLQSNTAKRPAGDRWARA